MTLYRTPPRVTDFELPSFPASSAFRDRSEEARERQERMRDSGYQEGYESGLSKGHVDGALEVEHAVSEARRAAARLDAAASALEAAAHDLRSRDEVSIAALEQEGVALGMGIATTLIGRELEACDEPVIDAMHRAAQLIPDRGVPVIRVHPADEVTVRDAAQADPGRWTADVLIVADASVEAGGCVVDVGPCRVDAQISTALARMESALNTSGA